MNFCGCHSVEMKPKLIAALIATLLFTAAPAELYAATCRGDSPCRACKNCKYCKRSAKEGGTCGVCKKG